MRFRKHFKLLFLFFILVLFIGFLIPQNLVMPVLGAAKADYNKDSFWYYPWGTSVTHKGIDIFAKKGTRLNSATGGMVLSTMNSAKGGKSIVVLGPKWRIHYYAHLDSIHTAPFQWVNSKTQIGTVGNSGNAKGKQAHLHYSIVSLIPYVWRIDSDKQGWKKMFFLNPIEYLEK